MVALLTRKLRVPYSVGLVATGVALALLSVEPDVELSPDLIYSVLLPPLIFEAAMMLRWRDLRRDITLIVVLATVGVMLSAALTAAGMHWLAGWDGLTSILFGVLIAATDPVSVIALFREAGSAGRLRTLVEAESLFNDGTAAVLFVVVSAFAAGQTVTPGLIGLWTLNAIGGGILCGVLVAAAIRILIAHTDDHLVELTFTWMAAYASFLLATHFGGSGVLATLCAGLIIGNAGGERTTSSHGREAIGAFWEFAAFVCNSLIFLLIGIHEQKQDFHPVWKPAILAIVLITAGRAAAIYPLCACFGRGADPVSLRYQHVLVWGGLRGALALALALSLPAALPGRDAVVAVAFAVVAFSIFVQGLSVGPMLRRMGEIGSPARSARKSG